MRELVGFVTLLGTLPGIYLIWGSVDPGGLLGLLLLASAGLFLQYRALADTAQERYRLLSQQISRLEELLKASQNRPTADSGAAADRPRE